MSAVTKPFKELGQEVVKVATTVGTGGTVRYDEDEGFKEGFVTKTALKEGSKALGNTIKLASNITQQNPELVDAVGMSFGIPNVSNLLNRKEADVQQTPTAAPTYIAPAPTGSNTPIIIAAIAGIGLILILFITKKRR